MKKMMNKLEKNKKRIRRSWVQKNSEYKKTCRLHIVKRR